MNGIVLEFTNYLRSMIIDYHEPFTQKQKEEYRQRANEKLQELLPSNSEESMTEFMMNSVIEDVEYSHFG